MAAARRGARAIPGVYYSTDGEMLIGGGGLFVDEQGKGWAIATTGMMGMPDTAPLFVYPASPRDWPLTEKDVPSAEGLADALKHRANGFVVLRADQAFTWDKARQGWKLGKRP